MIQAFKLLLTFVWLACMSPAIMAGFVWYQLKAGWLIGSVAANEMNKVTLI